MPDVLILTLATGKEVSFEVEDAAVALESFLAGAGAYAGEWIRISGQELVRRDAIVSVQMAKEKEPLVSYLE
jgi:hypothetical protein